MIHRRFRRSPHRIAPFVAAGAAAIVLLGGCATSSSNQAAEPREEKVYRTGSNLPQRDPVPGEVKTLDPSTVNRPVRSPGSPTTGGGG